MFGPLRLASNTPKNTSLVTVPIADRFRRRARASMAIRLTSAPLQLLVAACVAEDNVVAGPGEQDAELAAHQS